MATPPSTAEPLLPPAGLQALGVALADYTVDGLHELIGPVGRSALFRGDLAGVRRALPTGRPADLARLFLLGDVVTDQEAGAALAPLPVPMAAAAGLLEAAGDQVRARFDVRPYSEADGQPGWWVFSDFGSDVRPGPLAPDHVLGIGAAALTLAQATVRTPVGRALDLGTGCGIQALHLSRHTESVVGIDISGRALRLAATAAALSGGDWDLRLGSLLEPVRDEQFDLIVANPPFVVSDGVSGADGGYDYRDSGRAGDEVSRDLVSGLPALLAPGGVAQLLANWIVPTDGAWTDRVTGWLSDTSCDAWIWQREVAELGEYVTLWLRDAGEQHGTPRWNERYDRWLDWFAGHGVAAIGMGLVTIWRPDGANGRPARPPIVVAEDVVQAHEQPIGAEISDWIGRQRWLAATDRQALLAAPLTAVGDVVRSEQSLRSPTGWQVERRTLRQSRGMRWEVEADEAVAALVAGCDGRTPLRVLVQVLAATISRRMDEVVEAVEPVVRDLIGRGFLNPPGTVGPGDAR